MIGAKLSGSNALRKRFERIAAAATSQVLPDAILGAAAELVEEIRDRAPVRSGLLRSRIYASKAKQGSADQTLNVAYSQGYIVVDVFYARFVEFGTSHSAAHPFVRPALDEGSESFFHAVGVRVWSGLVKVAKGAGLAIESVEVAQGVAFAAADVAAAALTSEVAFAAMEMGVGALEVFAAAAAL